MTKTPPASTGGPRAPTPRASRLARARARFAQSMRTLLRPEGLPDEAAAELEQTFAGVAQEVFSGGPGRLDRLRVELRAAPPRLLDWMSGQVIEHPAPLFDPEGVELLAERQTQSIAAAVGALQLALVAAAAASTLEGGPVLALSIDGVVGQVASAVHGVCDWYNIGSYLVRRLRAEGIETERAEVRRLTTAALTSKGSAVDARGLGRSSELRLARGWIVRGVVDALPFGASLGRTSVRAATRIDRTDLPVLVQELRRLG